MQDQHGSGWALSEVAEKPQIMLGKKYDHADPRRIMSWIGAWPLDGDICSSCPLARQDISPAPLVISPHLLWPGSSPSSHYLHSLPFNDIIVSHWVT